MNDVMKKRLIGVLVLIVIGISVPVLLSRCMGHSGKSGDQGQMRVYNVSPNGQTAPANASGGNGSSNGSSNGASSQSSPSASKPAAVSPQSQAQSSGSSSSSEGFTTPPVHGNQGQSTSSESEASTESSTPEPSSSSQSHTEQRSREHARGAAHSQSSAGSSSGHDYGASTEHESTQHGASGSAGGENSHISGWVVQVASFSELKNAKDLTRQLNRDYQASYTPVRVKGRTWYHVNVGPYASESAAHAAAQRLKQKGHNGLVRNLP